MWPEKKRAEYLQICSDILVARYGLPLHGNKSNPLDEVIYIVLSSQTDEKKYQAVYRNLKKAFPSWKTINARDESQIELLLRPAGFSRAKAKYLIGLLNKLDADFGKRSLSALKSMSTEEAELYLRTLPGVGTKTARCVLMYSLNREVYPVDTHNFRVLKRLGAFNLPEPIRRWHDRIQELIPNHLRFSLHVTLVSFGREICKAGKPLCEICPLNSLCCYAQQHKSRTQD
jgi:endonuclease III